MAISLEDRIRSNANRILRQPYFTLVGPDDQDFVERVVAHLSARPGEPSEQDVQRATLNVFAAHLYECLGRDGTDDQRRAHEAANLFLIHKLLFGLRGDQQQAEDIASQAVAATYRQLANVRDPGAFLQYLARAAVNAKRRSANELRGEPLPADDPLEPEPGMSELAGLIAEDAQRPVEDLLELKEWEQTLLDSARRVLADDAIGSRVFEEHLVKGRSLLEVAKSLDLLPSVIYQTKRRILTRLRKERGLIELAQALGISPELKGKQTGDV